MNNEKMDIEQLAKLTYQDAELTPPTGAWDKIEKSLASQPAATVSHPHAALYWIGGLILGALLIAGIVLALPTQSTPDDQAIAQSSSPIQSSSANSLSASPSLNRQEVATSAPQEQRETSRDISPSNLSSTPLSATSAPQDSPQSAASPTTSSQVAKAIAAPSAASPSQPKQQQVINAQPTIAKTTPSGKSESIKAPQPTTEPTTTDRTAANAQPTAKPNFPIPNLITPNADGINDYWVIDAAEKYPDFHVQVYTSSSKRVYDNPRYNNTFDGADLPDGQYFYVIAIPSINYTRRGVLVIKR